MGVRQRFRGTTGKYEVWQRAELNVHAMIPVRQDNAPQEGFCMVHLHGHPDDNIVAQYPEMVEVVESDYTLYPMIDWLVEQGEEKDYC